MYHNLSILFFIYMHTTLFFLLRRVRYSQAADIYSVRVFFGFWATIIGDGFISYYFLLYTESHF